MANRKRVPVLAPLASTPDRTHEELKAAYIKNVREGRFSYEDEGGRWKTSEIAAYNRRLMFGENDEAFPSQEEWSRIVD